MARPRLSGTSRPQRSGNLDSRGNSAYGLRAYGAGDRTWRPICSSTYLRLLDADQRGRLHVGQSFKEARCILRRSGWRIREPLKTNAMNAFSFTDTVQELAESRQQLFEESSIAIHEIDTEGVIRSVNRAECMLLGYAPPELIGHYVWEFLAAENRAASRDGIVKKVARQQGIKVFTREFRRADGSYLWVEVHENLIENAAGEVIGIRSGLLDITERRRFDMEI